MSVFDRARAAAMRTRARLDALPGRLRRRRGVLALATLGVGVLGLTVVSVGRDGGSRTGSVVVAERGTPLGTVRPPTAYALEVAVERGSGPATVERVLVRRPFEGRVERPESPRGATDVSSFGVIGVLADDGRSSATVIRPEPAVGDIALVPALEAARRRGRAALGERRRITGLPRQCQVYRLGGSLEEPAFVPWDGDDRNYTDVCVDSRGLVLEEVRVRDGRTADRRLVTAVDTRPEIPTGAFSVPDGAGTPGGSGGASLTPLGAHADLRWRSTVVPAGFRLRGRYAVVPEPGGVPASRPEPLVSAVVEVLVRDGELLVVEHGVTQGGQHAFAPHPFGIAVDLGTAGPGQLVLGPRLSEVRASQGEGRYVRGYGTTNPDLLVRVARGLRPVVPPEAPD
jgi:hypothetical protein